MKKVIFSILAVAFIFTACTNESTDIQETQIDMSDFYVYTDADVDEVGRSLANGKNKGKSCYTMANLNRLLNEDPGLEKRMYDIEYNTRKLLARNNAKPGNGNGGGRPGGGGGGGTDPVGDPIEFGGSATIKVYVHVLYRTDAENISDAQIESQIDVLTKDFTNENADGNHPYAFSSLATSTGLTFELVDITRKQTSKSSWGTRDAMKKSKRGGIDPITPETHLNIWVCTIGQNILGYAQFPGGSSSTDGVVVDSRFFGTTDTATAPFDLGRTATHEVGHYLNLRHIWGDGPCSYDDFVADTPASDGPNYGCPGEVTNCGTVDMTMNYMDYTNDACMYMFSEGQRDRMHAIFASDQPRAALVGNTN